MQLGNTRSHLLQLQNRRGGEGKGILAVIVSPPMEIESEFSATKYFTASMTRYYPG